MSINKTVGKTQHMPTPWKLTGNCDSGFKIRDAESECVLDLLWEGTPEDEANAAFIVRAVNAHEELLKVLKSCVASLKRDTEDFGHEVAHINYAIRDAEQAIAKAEGR